MYSRRSPQSHDRDHMIYIDNNGTDPVFVFSNHIPSIDTRRGTKDIRVAKSFLCLKTTIDLVAEELKPQLFI